MKKIVAVVACIIAGVMFLTSCSKSKEGDEATKTPVPTASTTMEIPPPTPKPNPSPPVPTETPVYKIWPKVVAPDYDMVYTFQGAWGSAVIEAKVRENKIVEAYKLPGLGETEKTPVDITSVYTLNELLEAADNNPNAKVLWKEGAVHPEEIVFDSPDALDDEQKYTVQEFEVK